MRRERGGTGGERVGPGPLGVEEFRGSLKATDRQFVLVVARFHSDITERLARGAIDALLEHGVDQDGIIAVWVPGAWELPQAAGWVVEALDPDAVIAVGCVIRGETPHFDFVAGESARGLADVALHSGTPITFAVLTTDDADQALERSGQGPDNKGWEAALTALEMAGLRDALDDR